MTEDMNELLLKSVEILPPLPDTINKLRSYTLKAGSEVEVDEVARIISSDMVLTAKLLKLANSPFYGFSREIATINQVITLLGISNIINMVMADAVRDNFKIDVSPYGLNTNQFLTNCNEEVDFITHWLSDEDKKLSHTLVPCAILLRLGMVIFSNFLINNKKAVNFLEGLKLTKFNDISMVENQFLGVDHISFLGFLLHRWNFDETMIESICFVEAPHAASDEVKKSAYALAITNRLFTPYNGSSPFNTKAAIALLQEANTMGLKFNENNFLEKLPQKAKNNLKCNIDNDDF